MEYPLSKGHVPEKEEKYNCSNWETPQCREDNNYKKRHPPEKNEHIRHSSIAG
jgi:hypothetical protein